MALYCSPDYQTKVKSLGLSVQKKKFNIDFQDGGHLGFPIRKVLATFELQVTSILPMKLRVNWHFCSEEKVQNSFSTWLLGQQSWTSNQNDFSYFLSTSHSDTSYQVSSKLAFLFWRTISK